MKKLSNIGSAAALTALAAFSGTAGATDMTTQAHFGDELERCVAGVRAQLEVPADARLRHLVTEVRRRGAWYEFTLETALVSNDGETRSLTSGSCRANRFSTAIGLSLNNSSPVALASAN